MRARTALPVGALAVALAVLAAYLLPGVELSPAREVPSAAPGPSRGPEVAYLPKLVTADSVLRGDGAAVRRGDTLAFRQNDRYAGLREELLALAQQGTTLADAGATLDSYGDTSGVLAQARQLLREIERAASREEVPPRRSGPTPDFDRDLLLAEVMGAEDAIADLHRRLSRLSPPASADEQQQAIALAREVSERRAFLTDARARLARPDPPRVQRREAEVPRLTARQRARVLALTDDLAPDTAYVLSPATGTLVLAEGPARVITAATAPATDAGDTAAVSAAYELRATGLPTLWSRAHRRDSLSTRPTQPTIVVAPRE